MQLHDSDQLRAILDEARSHGRETGPFEAKQDFANPQEIGEYISALSNSAALEGKPYGFLVWGLQDAELNPVGTDFSPYMKAKGNEDFIPWIRRLLNPQVHFEFSELNYESFRVVVLTVEASRYEPVMFSGEAYIRDGSYKKLLKNLPDHARRLWSVFSQNSFERGVARERVTGQEVLELLDFETYFRLLDLPIPESADHIITYLQGDDLVVPTPGKEFQITNLGVLLFARDISEFPTVRRKAPRVTTYQGIDKSAPARGIDGIYGYAVGFQRLIQYLRDHIPAVEVFNEGVRAEVSVIPEKAVRELVANALIHQDLTVTGAGPTVDIFSDRIEVTNPGHPLVSPDRLIDAAPKSRNEALASLMRRMGICEERGSGWDQIAAIVEASDLPAPLVEVEEDFMRVTLFAHRAFSELSKDERVRAVYFHACLQQVRRLRTTNASLRERFRVPEKNKATVSRLIKDTLTAGLIAVHDEGVGPKAMSYVPFWAK